MVNPRSPSRYGYVSVRGEGVACRVDATGRADLDHAVPGTSGADTERLHGGVATSDGDRKPDRQAEARCHVGAKATCQRVGRQDPGKQTPVQVDQGAERVGPCPGGQIEKLGAHRVVRVRDVFSREPVADVILGHEDLVEPGPGLGLVGAHPGKLAQGPRGVHGLPGNPEDPLAGRLQQTTGLRHASQIRPVDARPQQAIVLAQQRHVVGRSVERDPLDLPGREGARLQARTDGIARPGEPVLGILLRPPVAGISRLVIRPALGERAPVRVDRDRLRAARPYVDPHQNGRVHAGGSSTSRFVRMDS